LNGVIGAGEEIGAKQTEGNEGFYTENSETKGLLTDLERTSRVALNKTIGEADLWL